MKQKSGFTLIELIVVIAIIGVLAAVLVPAMIGYISKSRIMSSNEAARNVRQGANMALTEMLNQDLPIQLLDDDYTKTGAQIAACQSKAASGLPSNPTKNDLEQVMYGYIYKYFSNVEKVDSVSIRIDSQQCVGVGTMKGVYPGSNPIAIGTEDYQDVLSKGTWNSSTALKYAVGT